MSTEQQSAPGSETPKPVGASELGRLLGVSHTAVAKALKAGRISSIDVGGKVRFNPDVAKKEWEAHSQVQMRRDGKKGGRPPKVAPGDKPAPDEFTAAVQQLADKLRTPKQAVSEKKDRINANNAPNVDGEAPDEGSLVDENGVPNLNRATATEKYYKALKAKLDFETAAGLVVPIEGVAKTIEQEYSRVRARLLAIPSKLAPEVALVEDVSLCRSQIEAAILDALSELSADADSVQAQE